MNLASSVATGIHATSAEMMPAPICSRFEIALLAGSAALHGRLHAADRKRRAHAGEDDDQLGAGRLGDDEFGDDDAAEDAQDARQGDDLSEPAAVLADDRHLKRAPTL
jgi:hypothetical protein